jgi:hypothetical protein
MRLPSLLLVAASLLSSILAQADANLRTCLEKAVGGDKSRVAWKTKFLFDLLDVHRYNLYYDTDPAAIVYPLDAKEISALVTCAAKAKVPVQARSGGHSFGNYGRALPESDLDRKRS